MAHFTDEQLNKAQAFVNQKHQVVGGHFEIATEKYHEETLTFFRDVFFVDEPVFNLLGSEWNDELASFYMKQIQDNLSLLAIDNSTGEIMGIRVIAPTSVDDNYEPSMFKDEKAKKQFTLLNLMAEKAGFYNRYAITEAFEFVALAVGRRYRKRGLGSILMAGAIDFLKQLNADKSENVYVKSLGSLNYSQAIFEKLGFESMYELKYEDFEYEGVKGFDTIGEHGKIVAYALKL